MKTTDILRAWKNILVGRPPCLSVEITKECPLSCPGCYAYNDEHLAGGLLLKQVSDFKGQELVDRFMQLMDLHRPLHVSIVGGEPLVRFRELDEILPKLAARHMRIQIVTSAVRPIPRDWARFKDLVIAVSIDGLPAEHDVRRKPATYERILKHIEGHRITVHCTVTRQMTERPGYLTEFMDFWSVRPETEKIWISLFTPQIGETSYEVLTPPLRAQVIAELFELRLKYPKLSMAKGMIEAFANPPSDPSHCIFARTTPNITADLKTRVSPCQFGGNPDCSQCGCIASAGLNAIGNHKLPGGIPISRLYDASFKIGNMVANIRGGN
jgi:sulfatase maturation enzyme AslB (radical SAM superfamily)